MRLLVTRPAPSHTRTMQLLQAAGHHAFHAPVMALAQLEHSVIDAGCDAMLATSAHVFDFLQRDAVAHLLGLPMAVVGKRTAAAARSFGFTHIAVVTDDAQALVKAVPASFPSGAHFVYLCARERSTDFAMLGGAYPVTLLAVYGADAVPSLPESISGMLKQNAVDGIVHYSERSAALFAALLIEQGFDEQLRTMQHFCLSAKVAAPLRKVGAKHCVVSAAPNEKALMETISAS